MELRSALVSRYLTLVAMSSGENNSRLDGKASEMKSLKPDVQTDEFLIEFRLFSKFVRFGSSHLFSVKSTVAGELNLPGFDFLPLRRM